MASVRTEPIERLTAGRAGRREPSEGAAVRTATSAVGGAILGAAIGGGTGAIIGAVASVAVLYAAGRFDKRNASRTNG